MKRKSLLQERRGSEIICTENTECSLVGVSAKLCTCSLYTNAHNNGRAQRSNRNCYMLRRYVTNFYRPEVVISLSFFSKLGSAETNFKMLINERKLNQLTV